MMNYRSVLFCSLCLLTMVGCGKKEKPVNPFEADFNQKIQSLGDQEKIVLLSSLTNFPWTHVCLLDAYQRYFQESDIKKYPFLKSYQLTENQVSDLGLDSHFFFYFIDDRTKKSMLLKIPRDRVDYHDVRYYPIDKNIAPFRGNDWGQMCYHNDNDVFLVGIVPQKNLSGMPNSTTLISLLKRKAKQ